MIASILHLTTQLITTSPTHLPIVKQMEKSSSSPRNLHLCLSLAELIAFFLFDAILTAVSRLHGLLSSTSLETTTSPRVSTAGEDCKKKKQEITNETRKGAELEMEIVEKVMEGFGLSARQQEGSLQGKQLISEDEFSGMFVEDEPSLEELKEAFCVFDQDGDGYIDCGELQKVLRVVGFREGTDVDACSSMIAVHDRNHDGRLDFSEFVRFMETCFC